MSGQRFIEERIQKKKLTKDVKKTKNVTIGSKITDHDLHIKVSYVRAKLRKGHPVSVKIENHNPNKDTLLIAVYKKMIEAVQEEAKIKTASKTSSEINLTLTPAEKNEADEETVLRKKAGTS